MLIRETRRLVGVVCVLFTLIYIGIRVYVDDKKLDSWIGNALSNFHGDAGPSPLSQQTDNSGPTSQGQTAVPESGILQDVDPLVSHNEVFSVSTKDKKFFYIKFGDVKAMNPNIIPHPLRENTWIIVAQKYKGPEDQQAWFTELVCSATFQDDDGALVCDREQPPSTVPIAATSGDKCDGDLAYFSLNVGPHDARVFFGPRAPYALYGSQSSFTCFGQWVQDFRMLFPWGMDMSRESRFRLGTELQRPSIDQSDHPKPPQQQQSPSSSSSQYLRVEKNWFLFWDPDGRVYAHYDIAPRRVFAALQDDGTAGPDLAPLAQAIDDRCLARLIPRLAPTLESIHQSTNSLSITLCRRADPSCEQSDDNTFIFTVFHHKSFYDFHGVYEPYVLLFRQRAPFAVYGVSQKPIWIHGRQMTDQHDGQSQMFYVVSMSWKSRGQKYHGYLDDVLFLAFGIEDENTAAIDVVAGDLLRGLGFCSDDG